MHLVDLEEKKIDLQMVGVAADSRRQSRKQKGGIRQDLKDGKLSAGKKAFITSLALVALVVLVLRFLDTQPASYSRLSVVGMLDTNFAASFAHLARIRLWKHIRAPLTVDLTRALFHSSQSSSRCICTQAAAAFLARFLSCRWPSGACAYIGV